MVSCCLQDQFEFALTAVAEEVNAILKALPQWNQEVPVPAHNHQARQLWLLHLLSCRFFSLTMMIIDVLQILPGTFSLPVT